MHKDSLIYILTVKTKPLVRITSFEVRFSKYMILSSTVFEAKAAAKSLKNRQEIE